MTQIQSASSLSRGGPWQVNRVESPQARWASVGRPVQDDRIDVHQFERGDERQDRRPALRDFCVGVTGLRGNAAIGHQ